MSGFSSNATCFASNQVRTYWVCTPVHVHGVLISNFLFHIHLHLSWVSFLSCCNHTWNNLPAKLVLELQVPKILLKGNSRPISFRTHSCSISFHVCCIHCIFTITAFFSTLIVTSGHARFISYFCKCIEAMQNAFQQLQLFVIYLLGSEVNRLKNKK